jgi:hypothetical protein
MWGRKKKKSKEIDESLDDIDFEGAEVEDTNTAGEIAVESIIASHIDFNLPYVARCDCSLCTTPYAVPNSTSANDNQPKVLTCLHTFCTKCIMTKMIRYNKSARNSLVICNICQAETIIEFNGMLTITAINQLLPDDVIVINTIELFADNKTSNLIDEYRKHEYTCSKCNKFGNVPKASTSYDSSSPSKNKSLKSSPAATNETTELNYDDMTKCLDCNSIICLKCAIFGTCRGHNMVQIHDLARETRRDLEFTLKDMRKNIENLVESVETINDLMQNTDYRTTNVKLNIKEFFNDLRSALDSQEQKFITAIDGYCEENMKEFGNEKLIFTEQILISSSAYKWSKFIHEKSSDVQYIRLHELMKQRLLRLSKVQMKVKGVTPTFTFSTEVNSRRNFIKYITDIGKTHANDYSSKYLVDSNEDADSEDDLDIFRDSENVEIIENAGPVNAKSVTSSVQKASIGNKPSLLFNPIVVICMILMVVGIHAAYILHDHKIIELDVNCAMIMPIVTYVGVFHVFIVAIAKVLQK